MAMQYDGKTYRNLQEQVAYLTGKWQELANEIDELRAQIPSKMIVEELPEEGDPLITYYVGPKGTAPNQYYEVWIWVQEEEDGPFVWRELEDTDQVDLSGYLEKQTEATTYGKLYAKTAAGDQAMQNYGATVEAGMVVQRDAAGGIQVPYTPSGNSYAASKYYVDSGFVAKSTEASVYPQAYIKNADGTQTRMSIAQENEANAIVRRSDTGRIRCASPTEAGQAATKGYVDDNFLAKQTGASTYYQVYGKLADGSQGMQNATSAIVNAAIVIRTGAGQINVPATPTDNTHAASKQYVDAAVGQLLYLHDIEIIVSVDATNKLFVKALWINGSPTAVAAIDSNTFKKMYVQYGCFGVDVENGTPCAVTKKPDAFAYDDFDGPRQSYLYQYISGGSLVSGETDGSMTFTFTDTVISF